MLKIRMFKYCALSVLKTNNNIYREAIRHARFRERKRQDAGVRYQASLFDGQPQDIEELEADFNALNMSHKQHVEQVHAMKEQEKYFIVKQKYFKESHPNFLTWSDKMQMKHLHSQDPEQWSMDRLSEGFPALPETVKKILKGNWSKKNVNKMKNHDLSVKRNWEQLNSGKLEVPAELREHLRKFMERKYNEPPESDKEAEKPLLRIGGEFSEIIHSYQRLKSNKLLPGDNRIKDEDRWGEAKKPLKETYLSQDQKEFLVKDSMTFGTYKEVIKSKGEKGEALTEVDRMIIKSESKEEPIAVADEIELGVVKYLNHKGAVSVYDKNNKEDSNHLMYPEKIIIPKKERKKGCTYKLNDCYYDDDGSFLYRVPGME